MRTKRKTLWSKELWRMAEAGVRTEALGFEPPNFLDGRSMSGLTLWDYPNIACAVYDMLGRHPQGEERLDAKWLRNILKEKCSMKKFLACYRETKWSPRKRRANHLCRTHWSVRTLPDPRFGFDKDPVDDWIHEMIERQMQPEKSHLLAIISHDGGFENSIRKFLSIDDSYVWIVGFLEHFSRRLVGLANCDRVQLVDLEYHAEALRLPVGIRSLTAGMVVPWSVEVPPIPAVDSGRDCRKPFPTQQAV